MAWQEASAIVIIGSAFVFAFLALVFRSGKEPGFLSYFASGGFAFLSLITLFSAFTFSGEIAREARANTSSILETGLWTANISDDSQNIMRYQSFMPLTAAVLTFAISIVLLIWGVLSWWKQKGEDKGEGDL